MGYIVAKVVALELRAGIPLPFRIQYRDKLYPDITLERLQAIGSVQQVEIFTRYYGVAREPQDTEQIREELKIKTSNQVGVQLARIENKLGSTKSQRLRLQRKYKKEYYKKFRPKCPHCKQHKSRLICQTGEDFRWLCGNPKCKKQFRTPGDGSKLTNRYEVVFKIAPDNQVLGVQVKKDGIVRTATGTISMMVDNNEDISFKF